MSAQSFIRLITDQNAKVLQKQIEAKKASEINNFVLGLASNYEIIHSRTRFSIFKQKLLLFGTVGRFFLDCGTSTPTILLDLKRQKDAKEKFRQVL